MSNLKSLLTSVGIVFFYVFATAGIVKLLWNTKDESKYEGRIAFIVLSQILLFFIYIVGVYWIIGPHNIGGWYLGYIYAQLAYCIVGIFAYIGIERK